MTSATPKPRAGEHGEVKPFDLMQELKDRLATTKPQDEEKIIMSVNWQKMFDQEHDMHAKVAAERDSLRERERELVEALRGLLQVATDSYAGEPWEAIDKARVVLAKVRL